MPTLFFLYSTHKLEKLECKFPVDNKPLLHTKLSQSQRDRYLNKSIL